MKEYAYLFPYEKVNKGTRIIIYGAGVLGQAYLKQMQVTGYCEVVAIADRNYEKYPQMIVPVIAPEEIHRYNFDCVVVALRVASGVNEVMRILHEQGIKDEEIICIFERTDTEISLFQDCEDEEFSKADAFKKTNESMALLLTGGIGDMIIQKRFIMELISFVPNVKIDIFIIKNVPFLEYLYQNVENVNAVISDLGIRYQNSHKKYALSMTIEACHFIKIDYFQETLFGKEHREFVQRIHKLQEETVKENATITTPVHWTNLIRLYRGQNAYTGFNYNGAFEIQDKYVDIPLTELGQQGFEKLKLSNYITINYGNGDCKDGSKIAKMWSKERFEEVIDRMHKEYPRMKIVQIGANGAEQLIGADVYVLGESFDTLAYVLKHAVFHLDIEGGMVHMASQLGTKCIVLFGPTVVEYYGYENNINIRAGKCHNCWGMYTDVNRCVREMEKAECMECIKVEMVMQQVKVRFNKVY